MLDLVTLPQRIDELVRQHGSLQLVAAHLGVDAGYLSRLRSGEKVAPTETFLGYLGLRHAVTLYERGQGC